MNELLGAFVVAASLEEVNKTLKSKGFSDYNDLISKIRQLDIDIAKAKDENKSFSEQEKLRDEYNKLRIEYEAAYQKESEKKKKNERIAAISVIALGVVFLIILFVIIGTL